MSLERSGRQNIGLLVVRATAANSYPSASTDGIAVPTASRGAISHILVRMSGTGSTVAGRVTICGYLAFDSGQAGGGSGETDLRNQWYVLAQLNGAADIIATTKTGVSPSSNQVFYAESLSHVSLYDRIYAVVSTFTAVEYITVGIAFESGQ